MECKDVAWDAFLVIKVLRYVIQSTTIFTAAIFSELGASASFHNVQWEAEQDIFVHPGERKENEGTFFCL